MRYAGRVSNRAYKDRLYAEFARVGGALASDKRLELLDVLAQAPRHVEALAAETEMSIANVSQHLQVLRRARLVEPVREGTKMLYRLTDRGVLDLWLALRSVAGSRLAEVEQITRKFAIAGADGSELPRDEMERLLETGEVFLIDTRPRVEYEHGHLPAAVSIPVDELSERLKELPQDRPIVAYCRGAYCQFADEAVALLRRHGFSAYRLEGGWPEWWAEGRPISVEV